MKFKYEGKIEIVKYLAILKSELEKQTNEHVLFNPTFDTTFINQLGNEILIQQKTTGIPLEIDLSQSSMLSNNPHYIEYNDEDFTKTFEINEEEYNCIVEYLNDGFSIYDVNYLLGKKNQYLKSMAITGHFLTMDNSSEKSRKLAWAKHKERFIAAGKLIIFEEDPLSDSQVLIDSSIARNFESEAIGYMPQKEIYLFDLQLEGIKRGKRYFKKDIVFPAIVLPDSLPSKYWRHRNSYPPKVLGWIWDEEEKDIFNVIDVSTLFSTVRAFQKHQHSYTPYSSVKETIPHVYIKNYFIGYEFDYRYIDTVFDFNKLISDYNLQILSEKDIDSKELIEIHDKRKISFKTFKEGLELFGIYNNKILYFKFNALKFNIPILTTLNEKTNNVYIHIFDLKSFEKICINNNYTVPDPLGFYATENLFQFEILDKNIQNQWNAYELNKKLKEKHS